MHAWTNNQISTTLSPPFICFDWKQPRFARLNFNQTLLYFLSFIFFSNSSRCFWELCRWENTTVVKKYRQSCVKAVPAVIKIQMTSFHFLCLLEREPRRSHRQSFPHALARGSRRQWACWSDLWLLTQPCQQSDWLLLVTGQARSLPDFRLSTDRQQGMLRSALCKPCIGCSSWSTRSFPHSYLGDRDGQLPSFGLIQYSAFLKPFFSYFL